MNLCACGPARSKAGHIVAIIDPFVQGQIPPAGADDDPGAAVEAVEVLLHGCGAGLDVVGVGLLRPRPDVDRLADAGRSGIPAWVRLTSGSTQGNEASRRGQYPYVLLVPREMRYPQGGLGDLRDDSAEASYVLAPTSS